METAAQNVIRQMATKEGGYVCFSNVHTVVTARGDLRLREIINQSFMSLPDGKPLSVLASLRGIKDVNQVAGPDFMPYFLEIARGARHFFYGSTPETLDRLVDNIKRRFPGINVAGRYSPPFGDIPAHQMMEIISFIKQCDPDIIWVGLGAPKQEYWMGAQWEHLRPAILMGVGAAFDFHAGKVKRAPGWIRKMGFEWAYRFFQEPSRLWRRYLVTNFLFIWYLAFNRIPKDSH
jgi:N-acetylglucosaminyldiphosphoundecaprenol N-acetyl-beta-D-mannosaminyltransferase